MSKFLAQKRFAIVAALSLIVVLGTLLRLHNLSKGTIGHIEIYTPGINLPYPPSDIPPRLSLVKSISGPIAGEPHPPGYYVFMFFWTKIFGVSAAALRFPSVLFEVGSIFLIFLIGAYVSNRLTALVASGMLALNGHHIWWSQISKMITMASFLGLLSTYLLIRITTRQNKSSILFVSLYVVTTLAGLATTVFFWPLFATQMLWVLFIYLIKQKPLPGILLWQLLIFILGSPLWSIAAYQSRRASYITLGNLLPDIGHFLAFSFLFEPDNRSLPPRSVPAFIIVFLIILAIFLLVVGLRSVNSEKNDKANNHLMMISKPPTTIVVLLGGGVFLTILGFAFLAHGKDPDQTQLIVLTSLVPLALPVLGLVLQKYWGQILVLVKKFDRHNFLPASTLVTFLAVVPVSLLALVAVVTPLFAPRNVFSYTPYFMIVLSAGMVALLRRNKLWSLLLLLLVALHISSVVYFKQKPSHPTDYKSLAQKWTPQIEDGDLIFVQPGWPTTPIFYYLSADRYHFVGWNYAEAVQSHPAPRVWVLTFEGWPDRYAMDKALAEYEFLDSIEALRVRAELYAKD